MNREDEKAIGGGGRARTQRGVEEVREGEQAEGVTGGGGIKDDACEVGVVGVLGEGDHLADGHRLIHPRRQRVQQLTWEFQSGFVSGCSGGKY